MTLSVCLSDIQAQSIEELKQQKNYLKLLKKQSKELKELHKKHLKKVKKSTEWKHSCCADAVHELCTENGGEEKDHVILLARCGTMRFCFLCALCRCGI